MRVTSRFRGRCLGNTLLVKRPPTRSAYPRLVSAASRRLASQTANAARSSTYPPSSTARSTAPLLVAHLVISDYLKGTVELATEAGAAVRWARAMRAPGAAW